MKYYLKIIVSYVFVASVIAFTIFGNAKADVYLLCVTSL